MGRSAFLMAAGGIIAAACLLVFKAFRGEKPEAEVRKTLKAVERAAEGLDFAKALGFISKSYRDPAGNTYPSLRRAALRAEREVSFLAVSVLGGWKVEVRGKEATASGRVFYYVLTRGGESDRDVLELTVYLRRERGGWRIYRIDGLPSAGEF